MSGTSKPRTGGTRRSFLKATGAAKAALRIGVVGTGRIASRFVPESRFVSGVDIAAVYNPHLSSSRAFAEKFELEAAFDDYKKLLEAVDAVYIASPPQFHYEQIMAALRAGVHVLCEKPMALEEDDLRRAYSLAREKGLTLLHAVKIAYCPAFEHLQELAQSGRIGQIVDVDASCTKPEKADVRELTDDEFGGSVNKLSSYPMTAITRLLGTHCTDIRFDAFPNSGVDHFTRGTIAYPNASASFKVGLGASTEGSLVVSGTEGYIYVPAPWWKTDYFEMRFGDPSATQKYSFVFEGDGLRYELLEFLRCIHEGRTDSPMLTEEESAFMTRVIEQFNDSKNA